MNKDFVYEVQDEVFWEFALKVLLGAILTPLWILVRPFFDSFGMD